ncbi:expressed unknown protein [Seminavis robusta]|uniref:HTH CENPB-type domain-containing protein n=1 Tax=Seminavis robusta TaxID=568900 RepID=A0A9N8D512_9STRA|nr:expressed unknown protein [Seminavis robusta]|eukprot:Sro6_g005040.1 n/a (408) ;mRNA; r:80484-81851
MASTDTDDNNNKSTDGTPDDDKKEEAVASIVTSAAKPSATTKKSEEKKSKDNDSKKDAEDAKAAVDEDADDDVPIKALKKRKRGPNKKKGDEGSGPARKKWKPPKRKPKTGDDEGKKSPAKDAPKKPPSKKPPAKKPPKKPKKEITPKSDGRKGNKGAAKRESYSVAFKAKMVKDYEAWEAERNKDDTGKNKASVREFVQTKNLGQKFEKFLSSCGWRDPKTRLRILDDAARTEYQHMARMPDRTKNKSYYAEMEEALEKRLEERRAQNLTVSTQTIRDLAREELKRLTNNDPEKVNAFKASNGWVFNFLRRTKRKARDKHMALQQQQKNSRKQKEQQQQNNSKDAEEEEEEDEGKTESKVQAEEENEEDDDDDEEDNDQSEVMINWEEIHATAVANSNHANDSMEV